MKHVYIKISQDSEVAGHILQKVLNACPLRICFLD